MNKIDIRKQDCMCIIYIYVYVYMYKPKERLTNHQILWFHFFQHVHYFINHWIGPTVRTALPALLAIFTRGLRFASKASGGAVVL